MDGTNAYELQKFLLGNCCCFIIRKELQNILESYWSNDEEQIKGGKSKTWSVVFRTSTKFDNYNCSLNFTKIIHKRLWHKQFLDTK